MKRKSLATLLSGFLTVCLTGVGFASWIITGGDEKEVTGNVTAETVDNRKTTITVDTTHSGYDNSVCFGHNPNKKGTETPVTETWFKTEGTMNSEDLKAKIYFKITNATYSSFAFSLVDTDATNELADFVKNNYITVEFKNFTAPTVNVDNVETTDVDETSCYVDVVFGWGTNFDTKNPYEYFNGIANPDEDDIENALSIQTLYNSLNGTDLKFKITAELK